MGMPQHPLCAIFPLHEMEEMKKLIDNAATNPYYILYDTDKWTNGTLQEIRNYFGEKIAFYFAFLGFYTKSLLFPTLIGIILFVQQLLSDRLDPPVTTLWIFRIIAWGITFCKSWSRRETDLAQRWGMSRALQKI